MNRVEYEGVVAYHPGFYVKNMIDELDMTQEELSKRLGTTAKNVSDLINGKSKLTDELALKLATVFGTSTQIWLNLQQKFAEKTLEIKRLQELDNECELAKKIDYSFFVNMELLPYKRKIEDKVVELLKFFQVASLKVLSRRDFLVQFRTVVATVKESNIINANAWVQTAINIGRRTKTKPFDEKKLKDSISEIRAMTVQSPDEFVNKLKEKLSECGIALVFMPNLKNCGVNGAVKWLTDDKVLLAINDRRKYADYFWFALFHELGHVLQKRKKLLIISEGGKILTGDDDLLIRLENEADIFAQETLIRNKDYQQFVQNNHIIQHSVTHFAEKQNIHPGIVVGRLQRDRIIAYDRLNDLRVKYEIVFKQH
jgi:HTH-type transcriptional regulator/antitoxin HigA